KAASTALRASSMVSNWRTSSSVRYKVKGEQPPRSLDGRRVKERRHDGSTAENRHHMLSHHGGQRRGGHGTGPAAGPPRPSCPFHQLRRALPPGLRAAQRLFPSRGGAPVPGVSPAALYPGSGHPPVPGGGGAAAGLV